jgi:hypothetical protein
MVPKPKYQIGELVFAKIKGYPEWPARVSFSSPPCEVSLTFFNQQSI